MVIVRFLANIQIYDLLGLTKLIESKLQNLFWIEIGCKVRFKKDSIALYHDLIKRTFFKDIYLKSHCTHCKFLHRNDARLSDKRLNECVQCFMENNFFVVQKVTDVCYIINLENALGVGIHVNKCSVKTCL